MKKNNAKAKREALKQQQKQNWQKAAAARKQQEEEKAELEKQKVQEEKKQAELKQWQASDPKTRKSLVKAVGVKSAFQVGSDLYLTAFGKGNTAILEKKIAADGTIITLPKPEESVFSAQLQLHTKGQYFNTVSSASEANAIQILNGRIQIPKDICLSNPLYQKEKRQKPTCKCDLLGLKGTLEKRYFGTTFDDDIHIRLIYNILDIEKILAEYTTNAIFALDNVSENDHDFLGFLSTRNPYEAFIHPEEHPEQFGNKSDLIEKVRRQGDDFFVFVDNKRIGYFGKAFFYQKGQKEFKKQDEEIYHFLTLIGSLRQWVTHSEETGTGITRTWLYQLENVLLPEYQKTMNSQYNAMVTELTSNFTKTNAANLNFLSELLDIPVKKLAESYFRFVITKEYKNLGFCIKTLREILLERQELMDIKENHTIYDSIRSKLYKMMDFVLMYTYESEEGQKAAEQLASSLRAALTEEGKEAIYLQEAERLWTLCRDKLLKIKNFKGSQVDTYSYKNMPIDVQLPPILKPAEAVTCFTKLMYILTLFLDGKEINDLLTTLINKFDNIRSFLETMEQLEVSTTFVEDYAFFSQSHRLCAEITQLKSFARMGKPISNAKETMMVDAVRILGTDKTEEELQVMAERFFKDENGNLLKKGQHGMRNFIASNVISNTRFHYLIRYGKTDKLHKLAQNETAMKFVLHRISKNQKKQGQLGKNQIDRYYETCGGKRTSASTEEKIDFLCDILIHMNYDQFQDVQQSDQKATPQERRNKEKYKAIISLYLTVLYLLVKNLVNINARYVIGFHCLERDAQLYSQKFEQTIHLNKRYTVLTEAILDYETDEKKRKKDVRTVHEKAAAAKNRHLQSVKWNCKTRENLEKADKTTIQAFRNTVAHLGVVRDADQYIDSIRSVDSYFGLYHYLVQKTLEAEVKNPNAATKTYFEKLNTYRTYCKDFLHVLCLPFAYCIPRYKNLSVEQLFDRNEAKAEAKDEWQTAKAADAELVPV
jgi:hypothetical protein